MKFRSLVVACVATLLVAFVVHAQSTRPEPAPTTPQARPQPAPPTGAATHGTSRTPRKRDCARRPGGNR